MSPATDHVEHLADDFVHELLSPDESRRVRRHCKRCLGCKEAVRTARRRLATLRNVPPEAAPEKLIASTLQRIETHVPSGQRLLRRLAWIGGGAVAAAVLLLVSMQVYYLNLAPTPYDLQVLGQTRLLAGSTAALRIRLMDRVKNVALAGVPVELTLRGRTGSVKLANLTTDADGYGTPQVQVPDWHDDGCELVVTARPGGATETARQAVRVERAWKLMLSSDKPVYQPGQVIRLRALTLSAFDRKPAAGRPTTFSITDPKGNVVFKRKGEASRYGIASADCALADELIEGAYEVRCQVEDTASALTVEVKRYVLPKFKVEVETDRPYYAPGATLKATVRGNYFFGKPVAGGSAEVFLHLPDGSVLGKRKATTGTEGKADVEFELPKWTPGNLSLTANVTDSAGQKESRTVSRPFTSDTIRIEVLPEGGRLVRGVANRVFILTSSPDGRPISARLDVRLADVVSQLTTNSLGVTTLEVEPTDSGIQTEVAATAAGGLTGRRALQLELGGGEQDFLLRTDKAVLGAGETLTLTADGSGSEPIFFDLVKDAQTILAAKILMTDGRGRYQLDLPAHLSGAIHLYAYRYGSDGTPVRKTRMLYVGPSSDLKLRTELDRREYRPGDTAKLTLTLADRQGQATPGAISMVAVDEAVFSVAGAGLGREQPFFGGYTELLPWVRDRFDWSQRGDPDVKGEDRLRLQEAAVAAAAHTSIGTREQEAVPLPHTLNIDTYAPKVTGTEQARRDGLAFVYRGYWLAFGLALLLTASVTYVMVWLYANKGVVVAVHCWLVVCLMAVCLIASFLPGSIRFHSAGSTLFFSADASESMTSQVWREANDLTNPDIGLNPEIPLNLKVEGMDAGDPRRLPVTRLREHFPETLYWRPELVTDDNGHVSLDLDLADSITTWRLTASAVTADGRLGTAETPVRVFQPFFVELNLPTHFTRGDEVSVPVVVYSYLDRPQTVELRLDDAPWFTRLDEPARKVELAAGEVKSLSYRLRLQSAGRHELTVTANGSGVADAVKRRVEVVADGRRVEHAFNGNLTRPAEVTLSVPDDAVEGGTRAVLKLYPSGFSQLVEGLDAIFQMPHGCFEQTSSTTYPNVLALDYLNRTNRKSPGVEAQARQYIHLGYQRLVSFEVSGGGFDWFGRPPANVTLTAYGLMEFRDMARVHDVDPNLISRTRTWLLGKRSADGSWAPEGHGLHDDPTQRGDDARLGTTAYIAWAVFDGDATAVRPTRDWLLRRRPDTIADAHTLALVCNALLACDANAEAKPYLDRLVGMKRTSEGGDQVWWELSAGRRTTFYGSGRGGNVETTALAALALLRSSHSSGDAARALAWLARQKDARGTWHSTQATVLALKALLAGTAAEPEGERRIEVTWQGGSRSVVIPPDQAEVMQTVDLTAAVASGARRFTLSERGNAAVGYQLSFRYHVPAGKADAESPLSLEMTYDRTAINVGDTVTATAKVTNRSTAESPMVVLELPTPAGFAIAAEDFVKLAEAGTIAKWQVGPGGTVVYLCGIGASKSLTLSYRLRGLMPVKVTAAAGRAYEYYDPDRQAHGIATALTVSPRP